ncbi:MAG TPA: hypothetical protein VFS00_03035 [Polyangiaceae bacterium]|nr:hypothetical protein [Polyangiaceae bacterium]
MKRSGSRFLLLATVASCLAFGAGCGDDDDDAGPGGAGGGGAAGAPAGGGGQGGGAGGQGGKSGAGGAGGAGGQGGTGGQGGASAGVQRVRARDARGPREGVEVLAHDAQGAPGARAKTGADGVAQVATVAGGSVSVAYESDRGDKTVRTYAGLDGSFDIDVNLGGGPDPQGSMRVRVTPTSPGVAPNHYRVGLSCADGSPLVAPGATLDRTGFGGCGGPTYDVLVIAFDAAGAPLAYASVTGAPLQPNGDATHAVVVDKTDFAKVAYAPQGAPAGFGPSSVSVAAERGAWTFFLPDLPNGPESVTGSFWAPGGAFFERMRFTQSIAEETGEGARRLLGYRKEIVGAPAGPVAWPAGTLAPIDAVTPDLTADPSRPSVAWQAAPQGALGDAVSVRVEWAVGFTNYLSWEYFGPSARAASARLVALPEDLAAYRPGGAAELSYLSVALLDAVSAEGLPDFFRQGESSAETLFSVAERSPASVGPADHRRPASPFSRSERAK